MPFKNAKHEMALKINAPDVWKKWVKKYGHAPGFKELKKKAGRKAARARKSKPKGGIYE